MCICGAKILSKKNVLKIGLNHFYSNSDEQWHDHGSYEQCIDAVNNIKQKDLNIANILKTISAISDSFPLIMSPKYPQGCEWEF